MNHTPIINTAQNTVPVNTTLYLILNTVMLQRLIQFKDFFVQEFRYVCLNIKSVCRDLAREVWTTPSKGKFFLEWYKCAKTTNLLWSQNHQHNQISNIGEHNHIPDFKYWWTHSLLQILVNTPLISFLPPSLFKSIHRRVFLFQCAPVCVFRLHRDWMLLYSNI